MGLGIFASWYLALEMLVKVCASVILFLDERSDGYLKNAEVTVFLLFGVVSTVCTLSLTSLADLEDADKLEASQLESAEGAVSEESAPGTTNLQEEKDELVEFSVLVREKYKATTALLVDNEKMILMFMFNASFGFFSSLNNFYLGGVVVTDTLGEEYVGFLSALTSLVAALFSFVLPRLMSRYGRNVTMAIGSSSWMVYVVLLFALTTSEAGTWQVLVPLYVLAGLGRGTWEAVVKAVWVDFFTGKDIGAAFAGLHVQSGSTGALGYFLFPNIGSKYQLLLCLFVVPLGFRDYLLAAKLHNREKLEGKGS